MYKAYSDFIRWTMLEQRVNEAAYIQQVQNWGAREKMWCEKDAFYTVLEHYKVNQSDNYCTLEKYLTQYCDGFNMR